jgi:hypothetical protein
MWSPLPVHGLYMDSTRISSLLTSAPLITTKIGTKIVNYMPCHSPQPPTTSICHLLLTVPPCSPWNLFLIPTSDTTDRLCNVRTLSLPFPLHAPLITTKTGTKIVNYMPCHSPQPLTASICHLPLTSICRTSMFIAELLIPNSDTTQPS